jgi:glycosyltransferase involved in cell wall biosynthesis
MGSQASDRIRILEMRSVRGTGGGPEKTILLGTAETRRDRFDVTTCYLRDVRDQVFAIDQWAKTVGIPYVEVLERHSFDVRVWPALRALVRERRIDIVHAHDYKTDVLAWLLARAERVTPLATAHGWTGHSWRERNLYYPIDRRVLARFPHLIAVSEDIRSELIGAGARPDAVTTILNGIDPTRFRRDRAAGAAMRASLGVAADRVAIGAVGRLEPQKRFDLLLDAFASIRASLPPAHLLIVGDGSLRDALATQVASLDLGSSVTLTGHRADIARVHDGLDLLVQSSDYEGTPNAVLEAMALETPIVATDVGGTRDIARPNVEALIVPPGNRDALGSAIAAALRDPASARARADAARRRVEGELSFSRRVARVEAIYEQLMRERTAGRTGERVGVTP